jgi:DNA-binding MarR family transcriptional regulator
MNEAARVACKMRTECLGMSVRQASRLLSRIYDGALRPLGIQESQLSVLVAIANFGDNAATIGRLAEVLVMDRTTLTRNLQPLEKAGYLRVVRAPDDARAHVIFLTRAGERVIESAFPLWEAAQKRIRRALGAERFDALHSQLVEVIDLAAELEAADP